MVVAGIDDPEAVLTSLGSTRCPLFLRNGSFIQKEADGGWVPSAIVNAHPTMVLEVAFRNESLKLLEKELRWWADSGVAVSLGVKIDVRYVKGEPVYKLMFLMIDHERGCDEIFSVDFSPEVCDSHNREEFLQKIPLEKILRGCPTNIDCVLVIDLFKLQQKILSVGLKEHIPG